MRGATNKVHYRPGSAETSTRDRSSPRRSGNPPLLPSRVNRVLVHHRPFPRGLDVARANERAFMLGSVPAGWELPFSGACAGLGATSLASERGLVTEARTAGRSCIL